MTKISNFRTALVEGIAEQSQRLRYCLHFPWRLTTSTSCPERTPRKGLGCKNNSLSYDKLKTWNTRHVKKKNSVRNQRDFYSGSFFHTAAFAFAAVVSDIWTCENTAEAEPDQSRSRLGCCWRLHPKFAADLIQVIQEVTPERDSVTDGRCAVQQWKLPSVLKNPLKIKSLRTLSHHHPALKT